MHRRVTRREFLASVGAGAASMALASCALTAERKTDKPNVLFIAVDDLNDWIGCLGGHPDARTPNIDRLAKRGVLFTNAQCAAPACNPSRAALMTGILPSTSGVYHNAQPWRPAMQDAVTIPQHFMAHGYRAVGGGKIFHGAFPDPASWQEYFPSQKQNKPPDPVPPNRPLNGIPNTAHFDWGPVEVGDEEMGDWKVSEWARGELARTHEKPFFVGCGIFRPHLPWYVPKKYFDMFPPDKVTLPKVKKDDLDDVPPIGRKMARPEGDHAKVIATNNWSKAVSGYLASIAFADVCIGRVLDALDASPYAGNTIIVLWGDHGWHLGEKLHWRKFSLWEEAARCPLMIVAPGVTAPGGVCSRPVGLIDIYPTLVDLCGLAPNNALEGTSLVPQLKDPTAESDGPALTTHGRLNHSLRSERWRYIRYSDGSEELYDHSSDEMEWTNLAGDAKFDGIKKDLARYLPTVNAPDAPGGGKGKRTSKKA
ncbi:MAG TPA: sulfatase [Phycisphaerae bacterium]|nr:sulfatase [Phycisphaerae bacterium]